MFGHTADSESRLFDLPDGRVLFYAVGRVYYVSDRARAQRLETQLKWIHNLSTLAIIGTILGAHWLGNWWLALGALPLVLLMAFAEHFIVSGCTEATDPAAAAQATARNLARESDAGSALLWPALIALAPFAIALMRGKATQTTFDLLQIAMIALAVVVAAAQLLRQRRARQQREIIGAPRSFDNTPIVPR